MMREGQDVGMDPDQGLLFHCWVTGSWISSSTELENSDSRMKINCKIGKNPIRWHLWVISSAHIIKYNFWLSLYWNIGGNIVHIRELLQQEPQKQLISNFHIKIQPKAVCSPHHPNAPGSLPRLDQLEGPFQLKPTYDSTLHFPCKRPIWQREKAPTEKNFLLLFIYLFTFKFFFIIIYIYILFSFGHFCYAQKRRWNLWKLIL